MNKTWLFANNALEIFQNSEPTSITLNLRLSLRFPIFHMPTLSHSHRTHTFFWQRYGQQIIFLCVASRANVKLEPAVKINLKLRFLPAIFVLFAYKIWNSFAVITLSENIYIYFVCAILFNVCVICLKLSSYPILLIGQVKLIGLHSFFSSLLCLPVSSSACCCDCGVVCGRIFLIE